MSGLPFLDRIPLSTIVIGHALPNIVACAVLFLRLIRHTPSLQGHEKESHTTEEVGLPLPYGRLSASAIST